MRVLVAGDRGYIGTVLVPFVRAAGHEVDGLDLGLYDGCDLGPAAESTPEPAQDMRDVTAGRLAGYHLLPAVRADLLRRLDRPEEAAQAYRAAIDQAGTEPERHYLERRLAEISQ